VDAAIVPVSKEPAAEPLAQESKVLVIEVLLTIPLVLLYESTLPVPTAKEVAEIYVILKFPVPNGWHPNTEKSCPVDTRYGLDVDKYGIILENEEDAFFR